MLKYSPWMVFERTKFFLDLELLKFAVSNQVDARWQVSGTDARIERDRFTARVRETRHQRFVHHPPASDTSNLFSRWSEL